MRPSACQGFNGAGPGEGEKRTDRTHRDRLGRCQTVRSRTIPTIAITSGNYLFFIGEQAKRSRDQVYEDPKQAGIQTKRYFIRRSMPVPFSSSIP